MKGKLDEEETGQSSSAAVALTPSPVPEVQKISRVYKVALEPYYGISTTFCGTLDENDFNALFTGNFSLCKNEQARELAEKCEWISAMVESEHVNFMIESCKNDWVTVYLLPIVGLQEERVVHTHQDAERADRIKRIKEKNQIDSTAVVPSQTIEEAPSVSSATALITAGTYRRQERYEQRSEEALVDPLPHPSLFSRRTALISMTVSVASLAYIFRNELRHFLSPSLQEHSAHSGPAFSPSTSTNNTPETNEKQAAEKHFGKILESSKRMFLPDTKTWRDNILKRDAVSEYFLGGKFRYIGKEQGEYNKEKQGLYRFAVIGEKSGQIEAKKDSEKKYLTTSVADAVNILLEAKRSNETAIKSWLVWTYQKSFGINLEAGRLQFKWKTEGQLDSVTYNAPVDFQNTFGVDVAEKMDAGEEQPGGNVSKKREPQNILGPGSLLLLPSGISPQHDLVVPAILMRANPAFTLKFGSNGTWPGMTAEMVSERIRNFEDRVKNSGYRRTEGRAFGRVVPIDFIAPLIDKNDSLIKVLSQFIVKDIPPKNHQARIMAIIRFVQSLPYRTEYDTDVDRPSFITLFNNGGDCNNLTILFNELMLAAGYDTAIFWVAFQKNQYVTHTRGGIPSEYFSAAGKTWSNGDKPKTRWVPIELAGKQVFNPGMEPWGSDETTFLIEEMYK